MRLLKGIKIHLALIPVFALASCGEFQATGGLYAALLLNGAVGNPAVTITPANQTPTVSESGATDHFTVVLNREPTAEVTVQMTPDSQLSTDRTTLTFQPSSWNSVQTVTISAVDDSVAEGEHTGTISFTVTSSDSDFSSIPVNDLSVTIQDNEPSSIFTLSESSGATFVSEGSGFDSYSITLNQEPSSTVEIAVEFDSSQIKVNGSNTSPITMTYTPANWSESQAVVVTAVNDTLVEGYHTSTVSHTITSGDSSIQSASLSDVSVSINDNDGAGVRIIQSGGSTTVGEPSTSDSYDIVLTKAPTSNVTIAATYPGDITLGGAGSPVTFTPSNWYIPQTVTVQAVNESVQDGTISVSISHSASSSDGDFNGITVESVSVMVVDDDSPGVLIVQSSNETTVTEGGASDSYTIALTTAPSEDVTVSLSFDTSELTVNGSSTSPVTLIFTPANFNTPQTVSVSAVNDSEIESLQSRSISHSLTSNDSDYNGIAVSDVHASIVDNDISPIVGSGVQTNEVSPGPSAATDSIAPVADLSKTFVLCYNRLSSSNTDHVATCRLSSNSTVEYQTGGGSGNTTLRYYVVEFSSGAFVQRGSATLDSATTSTDLTLSTAVDLDRSFVIVYSRSGVSGNNKDERRTILASLTDPTTLKLERSEGGADVAVEWQVVQLDGANVQSGKLTIGSGLATGIAPISPIDTSSSLLFFNSKADSATNGVEAEYLPHGVINSSTAITFKRGSSNNSVDISYYVIELKNGTSIQRNSEVEGVVASGSFSYSIPTPVDRDFSVPFASTWSVQSPTPTTQDQDTSWFTAEINAAGDTITLKRDQASEARDTEFEWYVMELNSGS